MPDRNWEKELADIDRRIGAAPDEAPPPGPAASSPNAPARPARPAAPRQGATGPTIVTRDRRRWTVVAGLLLRLLLAAALLAAVVVWPYESRCGVALAIYLGTIGLGALAAIWSAVASWRHRAAFMHVLSLLLLAASGIFAAREVLPRVGYAMPDPAHPAIWTCQ